MRTPMTEREEEKKKKGDGRSRWALKVFEKGRRPLWISYTDPLSARLMGAAPVTLDHLPYFAPGKPVLDSSYRLDYFLSESIVVNGVVLG